MIAVYRYRCELDADHEHGVLQCCWDVVSPRWAHLICGLMPSLLRATPRLELAGRSLRSEVNRDGDRAPEKYTQPDPECYEYRNVLASRPLSGHSVRMRLEDGFEVEDPEISLPWGATVESIRSLLAGRVREVTPEYLVFDCVSLNGMPHKLGLHFRDGGLRELEFFRNTDLGTTEAFAEVQTHLELTFGPPDRVGVGDLGPPSYSWQHGAAHIRHLVQYRFGPEEHVRIVRS
jgi:hypothetical protein